LATFFHADFTDEDYEEYSTDDFLIQYLGKDKASIKEANDYELLVKALVIDHIIEKAIFSYGEEDLARRIGCEPCPDERLESARKRAMGIGES